MPKKKGVGSVSKFYFYNKEENNVSVYIEKKVDIKDCPKEVITKFINDDCNVIITIKE